jgi:signal transduction histidine kinase
MSSGRRILVRLYLYALLVGVVVTGATIVALAVVESKSASELVPAQRAALTWIAEGVLVEAREPERLAPALASARDQIPLSFTVFDASGRVLAATRPGVQAPLDRDTLELLAREHALVLSPRIVAVAGAPGAPVASGYAVAHWERQDPNLGRYVLRAVVVFGVELFVLGFVFVPLARTIARPFERLASITQAFGLGDLRARAERTETDRRDEVGVLARAFNQMADRVEALRRTEKELIANVSHELRTPLARIRVVVELASEEEPDSVKRRLAEIAEDLTEVEQILEDIFATARLDLAKERSQDPYPALRLTRVPIDSLVDSLVKRFRQQHPTRPFHVSVDESIMLVADRVMLKHAVSNLLENAEKYSPAGRPIELTARRSDGSEVVLVVSDHGQGIGPEDLPHVFTPFFRADRSRTRGTGGVGLGLTLAKRIVEIHAGRISLESRLDEGTVVTVTLPLELPSVTTG